MFELSLPVVCDGLRLGGGAFVPEHARGLAVLLHGIPSVGPAEPHDEGYPGLARDFATRGWAAAWADMRGCRSSPGYFSIEGWVRDARAIIDAARSLEGVPGLPVAVVGFSAGGVVATEAIRRGAPADALVTLGSPARWTFLADDPREGVRRITDEAGMPLTDDVLSDPTDWAGEFERVTAEGAISSLRIPVLIVHGTADEVVPVHHAERIAARARGADVKLLDGAPHHLRLYPEAVEVVIDWLDRRAA